MFGKSGKGEGRGEVKNYKVLWRCSPKVTASAPGDTLAEGSRRRKAAVGRESTLLSSVPVRTVVTPFLDIRVNHRQELEPGRLGIVQASICFPLSGLVWPETRRQTGHLGQRAAEALGGADRRWPGCRPYPLLKVPLEVTATLHHLSSPGINVRPFRYQFRRKMRLFPECSTRARASLYGIYRH